MEITADQLFELFFLMGNSIPAKRLVMILLFVNAIPRNLEAHELMSLTPVPPDAAQHIPFLLRPEPNDDVSIRDLKGFFHALYRAYTLDREVLLDV
jgi:hypothetical protein